MIHHAARRRTLEYSLVLYTRLAHSDTRTLVFINTFQLPQGVGLKLRHRSSSACPSIVASSLAFRLFVARVLVAAILSVVAASLLRRVIVSSLVAVIAAAASG